MKKSTIVCILALAMIAVSGIANGVQMDLSVDGQYSQVMTVANTGGTPPTEIVLSSADLQNVTLADAANTMIAQQEASQMNSGSGAQPFARVQALADDTVNVGPGGDNFHAGKFFAPTDTAFMTTIAHIAQPTGPVSIKGGGSSHVGKFHNILDAKEAFAAGHLAHQALIIT